MTSITTSPFATAKHVIIDDVASVKWGEDLQNSVQNNNEKDINIGVVPSTK